MKLFLSWSALGIFILLAGIRLQADAIPETPSNPPDPFTETLPVLQANYIDFPSLQVKPTDHLTDLIARSQGGIYLSHASPASMAPAPILSAYLPGDIIYCRLETFQPPAGWTDFAAQIEKWTAQGAQGIVLDLRSNATPDDFDGAAQMAQLFARAGSPPFVVKDVRQSAHVFKTDPSIPATDAALAAEPIVVLVDSQTAGAAEALASCLQVGDAIVMGEKSSGKGGLFAEQKLSSGEDLHYLAGQFITSDGSSLWDHPIVPDIGLPIDPKREKAVLALIDQNQLPDVIREASQRHRLSEAALVKGEDPEIDAYLVPNDKKTLPAPAAGVPQDVVLVNALDSLKAIRLSERPTGLPSGVPTLPDETTAPR